MRDRRVRGAGQGGMAGGHRESRELAVRPFRGGWASKGSVIPLASIIRPGVLIREGEGEWKSWRVLWSMGRAGRGGDTG